MKRITLVALSVATVMTAVGVVMAQQDRPTHQVEPVINFRIPLSKASSMIYTIRYSTVMSAKDANELADMLVQQANDTVLNKPVVPQKDTTTKAPAAKPKQR